MAETAINVVFSKFGELATRELAVLLQVGGDIMQLGDQLEWLQPIIRDTDRKRRAGTVDGLTRVWVRQTRNAAFDAEDALDEFFHKTVAHQVCASATKEGVGSAAYGPSTSIPSQLSLPSRVHCAASTLSLSPVSALLSTVVALQVCASAREKGALEDVPAT
ncbi:hypothetical protein ACQ4PT_029380 [Festuca glaucescens]